MVNGKVGFGKERMFSDTHKHNSAVHTPELMVTSWTDYYPFGEVMPGRSSNPEGHLFGYQGQQKAANNSKWYAFQLRMYNPSLGRWNSTDPYYQNHSPYLAMANNPVSFIDPDGGKQVLTQYLTQKILRHLFKNKSNITRIEWLTIWMGATGMNHYQGITFEEIYSTLSAAPRGGVSNYSIGGSSAFYDYSDNYVALNNLLGPLGGGFLDHPNMVATPGQNDGTSGARDAGSGVYIDGLEVSASAAGIAMNNEAFAQNVDWKNTSTGNALLDATISKELDGNGVFLVGEYSQGVVVQNGQKILIGDAKLLKIIEVDYSRWLLAHVSAANAAKYLANIDGRGRNQAQGGGGTSNTGNALAVGGALYYAGESVVTNGDKWLGKNGKYNSNTWGGNGATGSRAGAFKAANAYKLAGRGVFILSTAISAADIYQGIQTGNSNQVISSSLDIFLGATMTFGGPIGFFVGGAATGIKYGLDNGYLTPASENPLNPDWQNTGICFIAGTEILMSDESVKNIEDVIVGDTVLTYNLSTQKIEANVVLQVDKPIHLDLVVINFANGLMNTNTPDHPYYVKGKGWSSINPKQTKQHYKMDVGQLEKGDTCFVYDSKNDELLELVITAVNPKQEKTQTYNLSKIANNSNFFANGILVHNKYNPEAESKEAIKQEKTQEK